MYVASKSITSNILANQHRKAVAHLCLEKCILHPVGFKSPIIIFKSLKNYLQCEEQTQKNNKRREYFKHLLSSFSRVVGVGFSISLGVTLYNYLKDEQAFNISSKLKSLAPIVCAASPFFTSESVKKKEEDISNNGGNRKMYNFIADVVEKVSDGVVYIEIKDHRRKDLYGTISNGSGFVIESSGLILTNAHVVANKPRASTILVRLADGKEYEGRIEELDVVSDLALVRIKADDLKPLKFGSSKDIRPGEFVVALGSPLSLSNTITSGVVSSVGRAGKDLGLRGRDIEYIQTDAAITFGNSGGPLVNLDGEVIGINSMKVTSGISFAIPVDYAKVFLEKAKKKRDYLAKHADEKKDEMSSRRRYLGITMLTLTPEIIMQMRQRVPGSPVARVPDSLSHGILVWRIVVGSPAYHAGLEPGDIVTHINGHEIHSSRDVYKILETKSDLNMVVVRKETRYSVTVSPEE